MMQAAQEQGNPSDAVAGAPAQGTPAAEKGAYVQVESGAQGKEAISAGPLVIGAYGFIWLVVMLFVWRVAKRGAEVDRDLAALKSRLGSAGQGTVKGG